MKNLNNSLENAYTEFQNKRYYQAHIMLDQIEELDPNNTEAQNIRSMVYFATKQFDKALALLEPLYKANTQDPILQKNYATLLANIALQEFIAAGKTDVDDKIISKARAAYAICNCLDSKDILKSIALSIVTNILTTEPLFRDDIKRAILYAEEVFKIAPESAECRGILSYTYYTLYETTVDVKQKIAYLKQAAFYSKNATSTDRRDSTNYYKYLCNVSAEYLEKKDYQNAIEHLLLAASACETHLKRFWDNAEDYKTYTLIYLRLAESYFGAHEYDKALAAVTHPMIFNNDIIHFGTLREIIMAKEKITATNSNANNLLLSHLFAQPHAFFTIKPPSAPSATTQSNVTNIIFFFEDIYNALNNAKGLQMLTLIQQIPNDSSFLFLIDAIKNNTSLHALNIDFAQLQVAAREILKDALAHNKSIAIFNYSEGLTAHRWDLNDIVAKNPNLLYVEDCESKEIKARQALVTITTNLCGGFFELAINSDYKSWASDKSVLRGMIRQLNKQMCMWFSSPICSKTIYDKHLSHSNVSWYSFYNLMSSFITSEAFWITAVILNNDQKIAFPKNIPMEILHNIFSYFSDNDRFQLIACAHDRAGF